MLNISVKNFGPIAEGAVDLKPLTVFLGPSNTGKSYMATAVYAVMRAASGPSFPDFPPIPFSRRLRRGFWRRTPFAEEGELEKALTGLREWADHQSLAGENPSGLTAAILPEAVTSWLETTTAQEMASFQRDVIGQLGRIHGAEDEFVSRGRDRESFQLNIRNDDTALSLSVQLQDGGASPARFDISRTILPDALFDSVPHLIETDEDGWVGPEIASILANSAYEAALDGMPGKTYYLPAARSGIVQGHKVLAAALVRQSSLIGIRQLNIPTLPGITTEFLSHLISLDRRMRRPGHYELLDNAIEFIETDVLLGSISLDESDGLPYPEIVYAPKGGEPSPGKFTIEHTSSMVSELAPLILFLKHLVTPGDLLILEEPESHLHPKAQLQMARGIARLVNAGVNVLITTHSNDLTGQINNLISMSNVSEEKAKPLGLKQEECLRPDQVSAYGFHIDQAQGGAVAYPLPVSLDVGIEDKEFLPVAESLYHQALELQDARLE